MKYYVTIIAGENDPLNRPGDRRPIEFGQVLVRAARFDTARQRSAYIMRWGGKKTGRVFSKWEDNAPLARY